MDFNSIKLATQNLIIEKAKRLGLTKKPKVVLGLSGGPDSVFLLHVLTEIKNEGFIDIIATHLDHQWREESFKDIEFCRNACQKLNIDFIAAKASELTANFKFNGSKEELGRRMRRTLFDSILSSEQADFIALAHHAQDQQETFFMRLIRGTTLSGLRCMEMTDAKYIRPLLEINKNEIFDYLDSNKIQYLTDPTNISDNYLRNRIRNHVLPALKKCDPRFDQKFKSSLNQLKLEDNFLQKLAEQEFERIFKQKDMCNHYGNLVEFKKLDPVLQRRIILFWFIREGVKFSPSTGHIEETLRFLNSPNGGQHKLAEYWAVNKRGKLFGISKSGNHSNVSA